MIDIKGYSSCFRLNKKHQTDMSDDDFYSLIDKEALKQAGLATSVNLSCIDIYPAISGKKNWYVLTALLLPLSYFVSRIRQLYLQLSIPWRKVLSRRSKG